MKRIIDHNKKLIYFLGDWPSVMGIPKFMEHYPGYVHRVLNYENFTRLQNEQKSF